MNRIKVMDFYADWCGPCKMMEPTLKQIEKELKSVTFEKVNADANPDMTMQMGVMSIPTLIIFVDGQEVKRITGFASKEKILKELANAVDK